MFDQEEPTALAEMSLDDARDAFDVSPSDRTAADYLELARQYWRDGIIEDDTFSQIVHRCAEWLADGWRDH